MTKVGAAAFALVLFVTPALADPVCTKLAWNLDHERALLNGQTASVASGATLASLPTTALALTLQPGTSVPLPHASQKPTDPSKGTGFFTVHLAQPGAYLVSLSSEAWIDLVQGGNLVASTGHTGDPNCPGLRKSVKFTLAAAPVTLEITNAAANSIVLSITLAK